MIFAEAFRILKAGSGQLWVTEMDFDTPGFSKLRANPLLFSLIRSTEPYLDMYAEYQTSGKLSRDLSDIGYKSIAHRRDRTPFCIGCDQSREERKRKRQRHRRLSRGICQT